MSINSLETRISNQLVSYQNINYLHAALNKRIPKSDILKFIWKHFATDLISISEFSIEPATTFWEFVRRCNKIIICALTINN